MFDLLKRLQEETATPLQPTTPEERAERKKNVKEKFIDLAHEAGLTGERAELYVKYMQTRWPEKEEVDVGYSFEWAERFARGTEWDRADGIGRGILKQIAPEYYPPGENFGRMR